MIFFSTVKQGIRYFEIFPDEPLLNPVFKEYRVKKSLILARRVLPPFVVLILIWAVYRGGGFYGAGVLPALLNAPPITYVCILFLVLMPLQGYYWFGRRAVTRLNAREKLVYEELCRRLGRQGHSDPTVFDLIIGINECVRTQGRDFLKRL